MYIAGDSISAVVDIGSETTKSGYSDVGTPVVFEPSAGWRNGYISPVTRSVVSDVGSYLEILCRCVPQDAESLVVSENTMEKGGAKREILAYLMERRVCESVLFVRSGILDVFSYGKTTGVAVSLGGGSSQVCSVVDGVITCRRQVDVGGIDLTSDFKVGMEACGVDFAGFGRGERGDAWDGRRIEFEKGEVARYAKEAVSNLGDEEVEGVYELAGGQVVDLGAYARAVPLRMAPVCKVIVEVIESNAPEIRPTLSGSILVGGGGGGIRGIEGFIWSEVEKERPQWKTKVTVEKSRFSTFRGGSIVGSMGSARGFHIGVKDYEEYGEGILDRKKCEWISEAP